MAVFQLHLGALVSGKAEQDGLNTIDQQDPTYETRVVSADFLGFIALLCAFRYVVANTSPIDALEFSGNPHLRSDDACTFCRASILLQSCA